MDDLIKRILMIITSLLGSLGVLICFIEIPTYIDNIIIAFILLFFLTLWQAINIILFSIATDGSEWRKKNE